LGQLKNLDGEVRHFFLQCTVKWSKLSIRDRSTGGECVDHLEALEMCAL